MELCWSLRFAFARHELVLPNRLTTGIWALQWSDTSVKEAMQYWLLSATELSMGPIGRKISSH